MEEELSPCEKLKLVHKFILQSPPGQVFEVIKDLKRILGSDAALLTTELLSEYMTQYSMQSLLPLSVTMKDKDSKMIISSHSHVDDTHYIDSVNAIIQEIDPITQVGYMHLLKMDISF